MRHRTGLIVECVVLVAGLSVVAVEVIGHTSPPPHGASAGAQVVPATVPPGTAPPSLPAACSPTPHLADTVDEVDPSPAVAANHTGVPLKDLSIQPADLTTAEWTSLLDLAQGAGVKVIFSVVNWASYQPDPDVAPDFSTLEQFVQAVGARGMEVRLLLNGFPDWARDPGEPSSQAQPTLAPTSPDELSRWAAFVSAVVSQFGSQVSFYEIWSEEDIPLFWGGRADPAQYASLLACSYVAAKTVDPGAVIVSGGLAQNDIGYTEQLYAYLDRIPDATTDRHFFDVLGVHPYGQATPPDSYIASEVIQGPFGTIDQNFRGFTELHTVMAVNGDAAKKIYIGEFGWPDSGYPGWEDSGFTPVPEATRAAWLPEAYRVAGKSGLVIAMDFYTFYATPYDPVAWALVRNPDGSDQPTTDWVETPTFQALAGVP